MRMQVYMTLPVDSLSYLSYLCFSTHTKTGNTINSPKRQSATTKQTSNFLNTPSNCQLNVPLDIYSSNASHFQIRNILMPQMNASKGLFKPMWRVKDSLDHSITCGGTVPPGAQLIDLLVPDLVVLLCLQVAASSHPEMSLHNL